MGVAVWKVLDLSIPEYWWIILPLSVFTIYNLDHLVDAKTGESEEFLFRRNFHLQNFYPISFSVGLAGLISFWIAWVYSPTPWIFFGLCLGILTLIYFYALTRFPMIPKELATSLIYLLGIWGIPVLDRIISFGPQGNLLEFNRGFVGTFWTFSFAKILFIFFLQFLGVFLNLIVNAYLDQDQDKKENFVSLTRGWTFSQARSRILVLGFLGLSLTFWSFSFYPEIFSKRWIAINYLFLYLVPIFVFLYSPKTGYTKDWARFLGEIPFLSFLFHYYT